MVHDGLWDAFNSIHMGVTSKNLADQYNIHREEQDEFAAASQQKAEQAVAEGVFAEEIVPIEVPIKGGVRLVDQDEHPRAGTTAEALGKLRAAFRDGGTVTAGNASGINDGAAAIVPDVGDEGHGRGLRTFGAVESYASVGVDPRIMGIGPVPAVRKALARAGLEFGDIDLFELNEAFAAQSLAVLRELEGSTPNGSIRTAGRSLSGRPIGASGGQILVTLLRGSRRRHAGRGLATLCVGGGQGQAAIVRNGA